MALAAPLGRDAMATNRKRRTRGAAIDGGMYEAMVIHAKQGDCFLAGEGLGCACGLRGADGNEREDLISQIKERMANDSHAPYGGGG